MSTLSPSDDPYDILGVPRDAEAAQIKKAYFTLMRQFSPETHPDEYNRLHSAYERLKDPAARAELDRQTPMAEVPAEVRAKLQEALGRQDLASARGILEDILRQKPHLTEVRESLQNVLLDLEAYDDAAAQLEILFQGRQRSPEYFGRRCVILGQLRRFDEAASVAQAWLEVTGGTEADPWRAHVTMLAAAKKLDEAERQLMRGLERVPDQTPLLLTWIFLGLDNPRQALAPKLARLREALPAEATDDTRRMIAERLKSLAALYFDRDRTDEANTILALSSEVARTAPLTFPEHVDLDIDALPEASRTWLTEESTEPHLFHIKRRSKTTDLGIAGMITALGAAMGALLLSGGSSALLAAVSFAALAAACVWAWGEVVAGLRSSHARMLCVHPLYLLEAGPRRLTAWPLVNLRDANITHVHQNGSYASSRVKLHFASKTFETTIGGEEASVEFVQRLQQLRFRALELMHGGLLEADEALEFIPAAALRSRPRRPVAVWAFAAVAALALTIAADHASARRDRAEAWAMQLGQEPPETAPAPDEEAERAAQAHIAARREALVASLEASAQSPELAARVRTLLGTLDGRPIALRWSVGALPSEARGDESTLAALAVLGQTSAATTALFAAMTEDAQVLVPLVPESTAEVRVRVAPRVTDQTIVVGASRYPALGLTLSIEWPGGPPLTADVRLGTMAAQAIATRDDAATVGAAEGGMLVSVATERVAWELGLSRALLRPGAE